MAVLSQFLKDDAGASAAEYALILAVLGVGIIAACLGLKDAIGSGMNRASNCMSNASSSTC
jgi:pilus assembly protein Flp/PilA